MITSSLYTHNWSASTGHSTCWSVLLVSVLHFWNKVWSWVEVLVKVAFETFWRAKDFCIWQRTCKIRIYVLENIFLFVILGICRYFSLCHSHREKLSCEYGVESHLCNFARLISKLETDAAPNLCKKNNFYFEISIFGSNGK